MPATPSQSARIAALTRVSQVGGAAVSAPARAAFMESFYDQVDPDRALAEDERERRATAARKAYFARLGAKSADVRRRRSAVSQLRAELAELEAGDSDVA